MADEVKTMWQSGIWQLAEYDIILLHILILIVRLNTTWTSGNWWNGHLATGGIWHYYIANWLIVGWGYLYSIVPLFGTGMWVEWLFIVPPLGVMLIGIFLIHSHPWKQCFPCLPITSYISNLLHPWKQCLPSQLSQQRSSALQIASDDRSSEESASQKMIISLPNNVHGRQFTDWPLNSS